MGFEQLAALKEQLAKQAKSAPQAKAPRVRPAVPVKRSKAVVPADRSKPVDPVLQAIAKLQKRFPAAFPKNPAPKVPLKVGLFEDLTKHAEELALAEPALLDALRTWCRGTRYWTCLAEGAPRVDLSGQEAGQVSQADAKWAQQLQARRAMRPAQHPAKAAKAN
ncbi:ProQ/FinO family protein [Cupriavidus sp. 2TAF22]|uniref:ProQ/FinO family protein n=1 Tax=unclassified Cupriavidus TaxID=2640874 RepID=UPI003F92BA8C